MSLIKSISKDIYRLIYKFMNPISMKYIIEKKVLNTNYVSNFLLKNDKYSIVTAIQGYDEKYSFYTGIRFQLR